MGHISSAKCLECGEAFELDSGGGFFFHLVRCDVCGVTKSVSFDDLGEFHSRYLKGLSGPYCIASTEHDENVRKQAPIQPISEAEYYTKIEAIAGKCSCGGNFTLNAPPRCPKCHSTHTEEGEPTVFYD